MIATTFFGTDRMHQLLAVLVRTLYFAACSLLTNRAVAVLVFRELYQTLDPFFYCDFYLVEPEGTIKVHLCAKHELRRIVLVTDLTNTQLLLNTVITQPFHAFDSLLKLRLFDRLWELLLLGASASRMHFHEALLALVQQQAQRVSLHKLVVRFLGGALFQQFWFFRGLLWKACLWVETLK